MPTFAADSAFTKKSSAFKDFLNINKDGVSYKKNDKEMGWSVNVEKAQQTLCRDYPNGQIWINGKSKSDSQENPVLSLDTPEKSRLNMQSFLITEKKFTEENASLIEEVHTQQLMSCAYNLILQPNSPTTSLYSALSNIGVLVKESDESHVNYYEDKSSILHAKVVCCQSVYKDMNSYTTSPGGSEEIMGEITFKITKKNNSPYLKLEEITLADTDLQKCIEGKTRSIQKVAKKIEEDIGVIDVNKLLVSNDSPNEIYAVQKVIPLLKSGSNEVIKLFNEDNGAKNFVKTFLLLLTEDLRMTNNKKMQNNNKTPTKTKPLSTQFLDLCGKHTAITAKSDKILNDESLKKNINALLALQAFFPIKEANSAVENQKEPISKFAEAVKKLRDLNSAILGFAGELWGEIKRMFSPDEIKKSLGNGWEALQNLNLKLYR